MTRYGPFLDGIFPFTNKPTSAIKSMFHDFFQQKPTSYWGSPMASWSWANPHDWLVVAVISPSPIKRKLLEILLDHQQTQETPRITIRELSGKLGK